MTQQVLLKRSAVQDKIPTTGDLALGEVAINTYDGRFYFKKDNGTASLVELVPTTVGGTISSSKLGTGTADSTTYLRGDGAWSTITSGATITDDTSSNTTYYPSMATATSGAMLSAKVSSTKFTFNPNTGIVSATGFNGSGANLTSLNASNLSSGTVGTARLGTGTADSTTYLRGDGTWATVSTVSNLDSLTDVVITTPSTNQVLQYNGTNWVNTTAAASGATLSAADTSSTYYIGMTATSSGSWTDARVDTTDLYFSAATSTLYATNFNTASDINLKENVVKIENGLETVKQLQGVGFDWKSNGKKSFGVIAQELEQILPDLVDTNVEGGKSVNYLGIIGFLIEAVKELDAKISKGA